MPAVFAVLHSFKGIDIAQRLNERLDIFVDARTYVRANRFLSAHAGLAPRGCHRSEPFVSGRA